MKIREINGEYFEIIKSRTLNNNNVDYRIGTEDEIFEYYERPSLTKIEIWSYWVQWANETEGVVRLHISGANCFTFSITGRYIEDGKEYLIYITKCHNSMYLLN